MGILDRFTRRGRRGVAGGRPRRGAARAGPRPGVESLEGRALLSAGHPHLAVHAASSHGHGRAAYVETDLVSNGTVAGTRTDANLVNAWGLASGPTSPFWVSDNGAGVSTLYGRDGGAVPLVVTIPPPAGGTGSAPTGVVFNTARATDFLAGGAASHFLFATEDGTISAWASGTSAVLEVDNSATTGAVYKGLAMANSAEGSRLYATDFHNGRIDVFDAGFQPVTPAPGAFSDPRLPRGYAPFGIANIGGDLFVTYAKQDSDAHDDVAGRGHGFVDAYDPEGHLIARVASRGPLNSPWGLAVAPIGFGRFGGDLLVGNFGDGRISAYRPGPGGYRFDGQLAGPSGRPIAIDGLWGLKFGDNVGEPHALYFTAGPNHEMDGLFGKLTPA